MNEKPIVADALFSLLPNAQFVVDNGNVLWYSPDIPQPSEEEINTELSRLQSEYDALQYQRDRKAEYPSLDELIVALWEGVVEERMASVTALEGLRQAVKDKYPKPE